MENEHYQYDLGAVIGKAAKSMAKTLARKMKEAGHDLNIDHFVVLVHLWHEDGQVQQKLGESAGKDKTSVTRAIDTLEKKNFVLRVVDQTDRRNKRVYLTHSGRELKSLLQCPMRETVDKATEGITDEDLKICSEVLRKIIYNLSEIY